MQVLLKQKDDVAANVDRTIYHTSA